MVSLACNRCHSVCVELCELKGVSSETDLVDRGPFAWVLFHEPVHQVLDLVRVDARYGCVLDADDLVQQLLHALRVKRVLQSEHLVQDHS